MERKQSLLLPQAPSSPGQPLSGPAPLSWLGFQPCLGRPMEGGPALLCLWGPPGSLLCSSLRRLHQPWFPQKPPARGGPTLLFWSHRWWELRINRAEVLGCGEWQQQLLISFHPHLTPALSWGSQHPRPGPPQPWPDRQVAWGPCVKDLSPRGSARTWLHWAWGAWGVPLGWAGARLPEVKGPYDESLPWAVLLPPGAADRFWDSVGFQEEVSQCILTLQGVMSWYILGLSC